MSYTRRSVSTSFGHQFFKLLQTLLLLLLENQFSPESIWPRSGRGCPLWSSCTVCKKYLYLYKSLYLNIKKVVRSGPPVGDTTDHGCASSLSAPLEVLCEIKILDPNFNFGVEVICPETDFTLEKRLKNARKNNRNFVKNAVFHEKGTRNRGKKHIVINFSMLNHVLVF